MHILPAAGSATRFGGIPKYLLPGDRDGKNLISLHIDMALESDIDKIIIMTHPHMHDYLKTLLSPYKNKVIVDSIISNTMTETIVAAALKWSNNDEIISVTLPDTATDSLLNKTLKNDLVKLRKKKNSLLAFEYIDLYKGKFGQIDLDSVNREVRNIADKNPNCLYKNIWGGLAIQFEYIKNFDIQQQTIGNCIMKLIEKGTTFHSVESSGQYYDCGNFSDYLEYLSKIRSIF